ncbi:MAG: TlpA disulfide reductase family protein [Paludibacter sp.]|nr:TlpA disulfide reductase family protein [Paludibacter sp.]
MKKLLILPIVLILFLYSESVLSQPKVGDIVHALTKLKIINNDFPDLENKFVFVDFWATYCIPEVRSLEHLNKLAERFKNEVVFLAITDENEEHVRGFLQNQQWNNIFFGLDEEHVYFKDFSTKDIPVYYLISPDKIILSTGVSDGLADYKLDSIVNKVDSLRQIKTSELIFHQKYIEALKH